MFEEKIFKNIFLQHENLSISELKHRKQLLVHKNSLIAHKLDREKFQVLDSIYDLKVHIAKGKRKSKKLSIFPNCRLWCSNRKVTHTECPNNNTSVVYYKKELLSHFYGYLSGAISVNTFAFFL